MQLSLANDKRNVILCCFGYLDTSETFNCTSIPVIELERSVKQVNQMWQYEEFLFLN